MKIDFEDNTGYVEFSVIDDKVYITIAATIISDDKIEKIVNSADITKEEFLQLVESTGVKNKQVSKKSGKKSVKKAVESDES